MSPDLNGVEWLVGSYPVTQKWVNTVPLGANTNHLEEVKPMAIKLAKPSAARFFATAAFAAATFALTTTAHASWTLDGAKSELSYLSTKVVQGAKKSVTERNHFKTLSGGVSDDGKAQVTIELASVETNIPIRNERMQKHVLGVANQPQAVISAQVLMDKLTDGAHSMELDASLSLNGYTEALKIPVLVVVTGDSMQVIATQPVLLNATKFGMFDGLMKLTQIAKLLHIPTTVPVSFNLNFSR